MTVEISAQAPGGWDAYVEGHSAFSAYHLAAAVGIGEETFKLRTFYLHAHDSQGLLTGVLPLVEQSSLLFGRFLVSLPFFTYGGILADTPSVARELVQGAGELAQRRGAAHVELRHVSQVDELQLPARLDKVSMILQLPQSSDLLSQRLGSKLRSQIRRADRENPEIVWGGAELVTEFYQVFSRSMHELGTPVYPRRFFEIACRGFGPRLAVLVVRMNGVAQAAAITIRHGSTIEVPWAAASDTAKRASINMRMYWEMLSAAIKQGAAAFDFGRCTTGSGTHKFKAQWGAQPLQLHWHYWLAAGREIPMLNHSNPKYARVAALWKSMPLWCANLIGPRISRNLP